MFNKTKLTTSNILIECKKYATEKEILTIKKEVKSQLKIREKIQQGYVQQNGLIQTKEMCKLKEIYDKKEDNILKNEEKMIEAILKNIKVLDIEANYLKKQEELSKINSIKNFGIGFWKKFMLFEQDNNVNAYMGWIKKEGRRMINNFSNKLLYDSSVDIVAARVAIDAFTTLAQNISEKYFKIIEKKNWEKKIVYFTEQEIYTMKEIIELLDKLIELREIIVLEIYGSEEKMYDEESGNNMFYIIGVEDIEDLKDNLDFAFSKKKIKKCKHQPCVEFF